MRSLKCKVLMFIRMFGEKEAGKAFYRERRWKKIEEEKKKFNEKKKNNIQFNIKNKKRKFYFASKKKFTRNFINRNTLKDNFKVVGKDKEKKLCSSHSDFRSLLGRNESYPFLSLTNQDLLRHPDKIKIICEKLKSSEINLVIFFL